MDRLARNLDDLRALVQGLTGKGVRAEFVKESLVFTGEDSPMANLMLSVMGAFAEFERPLIRERQREGIALARQRGAYKGRKKTLTPERAAELVQRAGSGVPKAVLARDYGINRETVYQSCARPRGSEPRSPACAVDVQDLGSDEFGYLAAGHRRGQERVQSPLPSRRWRHSRDHRGRQQSPSISGRPRCGRSPGSRTSPRAAWWCSDPYPVPEDSGRAPCGSAGMPSRP